MKFLHTTTCLLWILGIACGVSAAQMTDGVDPDAIIERALAFEEEQRSRIHDIVFDAEYIEGEMEEGEFVEKERFLKKVYIKYLPDTALFHEEYLEYFQNGELQSEKRLEKEAAKRIERRKSQSQRDISFSMLRPFTEDLRDKYAIEYQGLTTERINGFVCHQFRVTALTEDKGLINGDYYFEPELFRLVRVDFSPARLPKGAMFRMSELQMSLVFDQFESGLWLPSEFSIAGRAKAMLLIGIKFAGTEYYRSPEINTGLGDSLFVDTAAN